MVEFKQLRCVNFHAFEHPRVIFFFTVSTSFTDAKIFLEPTPRHNTMACNGCGRYSMHQALDADELHPVDCFGLPIAAPSGVGRRKMVADWIQRQQHNWPGNTRAVLFYQAQAPIGS